MVKKNKIKKVVGTVTLGMDKKADFASKNPIDNKCEGCEKIESVSDKKYCIKYVEPSFHWEDNQTCSFATHVKREVNVAKKIINPLKASKRAVAKKV